MGFFDFEELLVTIDNYVCMMYVLMYVFICGCIYVICTNVCMHMHKQKNEFFRNYLV